MTNHEYNAARAATYRELAANTTDAYLKKFYLNAARGHDLRNINMSISEALKERS